MNDLKKTLYQIPNTPHDSVPVGLSESENIEVRKWGGKVDFDFEPKTHMELGDRLNLFDFKAGSKLSGSGFPLYIGEGAKLERRLINTMIDFHIEEYDFKEIIKKYDLNNYIVMIVYKNNNQLKILSKIHLNNDYKIINKNYENINLNDKKSLEVFIKDIKNEYEDSWKDLNKINTSIKLPLTVTIESKNQR